jgi:hypothetical protein
MDVEEIGYGGKLHSFGIGSSPAASYSEHGKQLQAVYENWNFLSS